MSFVFLYVTARNEREASKIARHLFTKKLLACANIFPIRSVYRWKGKIREEREAAVIIKTVSSKALAATKEIEKIHPYSIPCITQISVRPNEKYARWLWQQLQ